MAKISVEEHVDAFLGEWLNTVELTALAMKTKNLSLLKDTEILPGLKSRNLINRAGADHLKAAATGILFRERLSSKLSVSTARKALIEGFAAHLPKALKKNVLSEHAVIAKAVEILKTHPRDDGTYLFPVVFAPLAKDTDFRVGVARIVAKPVLERELADAWKRHAKDRSEIAEALAKDWREHSTEFDHYIAVDIDGFEESMAWPAARDAAETLLNIIRMFFRFPVMDDVRIGDGFIWQNRRSKLRLTSGGDIWLSSSFGGSGSHLEDGWQHALDYNLAGFGTLLASLVSWMTHDDGRGDPVLERLTYFNRLVAEAYCEPHHPVRLVRLISALEALSVIGASDKAHNLAHRCAAAGGWADTRAYCEIYDAVREAYRWRNAVVHGDAPTDAQVMRAFRSLELHLLHIYLGLLSMHAGIASDIRPTSIRQVRREFAARIDLFFWMPSLVA